MQRRTLLASLLCLTLVAAAPTAAGASSGKQQRGGATTLALDQGTAAALDSAGISVKPIRPASAGAAGIAFPITGARLATDPVGGWIAHSGGLKFRSDDAKLRLTDFVIQLDDAPDLTARAGGQRVSILDLDLSQAQIAQSRAPADGHRRQGDAVGGRRRGAQRHVRAAAACRPDGRHGNR